MLPGYAIADTLFAALSAGRGEAARTAAGDTGEAGGFEALLRDEAGGNNAPAKSSAGQTGGQAKLVDVSAEINTEASAEITGQPAPAPSVAPEPDPLELPVSVEGSHVEDSLDDGQAQDGTDPAIIVMPPETGAAPGNVESIATDEPEPSNIRAHSLTEGESPAAGMQNGAAEADMADADTAEDSRPDEARDTTGKADAGKSAGAEPAAPAAPAAPSSDAAQGTGKPAEAPANQAAQPSHAEPGQPKAASGQQAPVQPQTPAQAQAAAPQSAPAADPAGGTRAPEAAQTASTNAQQAKADLIAQPGKAEGDVPNTAALRRETGRGMTRGPEGLAQARAAAEKAETGAKDAPVQARSSATLPANPAPSQAPATPPQPAAPAVSMAAMLTALQSGIAAPEALEASEATELRLESSSPLLARNESASVAGTRTTSAMPHLRMASGHVAELGQMIARRFADGSRSFDIRLDPPELGRVQVRLEIGADRSVQAMLTAEKPEALAELQRNARELEKALADAGLDLGENGIGFALSEGGSDEQAERDPEERGAQPSITSNLTISEESISAPVSRYGFLMTGRTGVDMRI
ncbi:flagellar hook-length control protein [Glycocaulis alkaliphilus]|uniref:Flagellar hook-length control protein n=1 Tax=Glycocaulis alkaliphilus TaxID=1434191 RepID=A0A3T0EC87_9PROT|nr:flagellar hook-length control protein FliK [Glycocaulis alkaliphilus]AZU04909.1 flagellar hook-length control protein [Glycocaulis alkaliphilus]GGB66732.1 flagellar hook-length control protein FliK [Glycocaulis alkaliphilus]